MGYILARWNVYEEVCGEIHRSQFWNGKRWTPNWSDAVEYLLEKARTVQSGLHKGCCLQTVHPPEEGPL